MANGKKVLLYVGDKSLIHCMRKTRKVGGGTISILYLLDFLKEFYSVKILVFSPDLPEGVHWIKGFEIVNFKVIQLNRLNFIDEFMQRYQYKRKLKQLLHKGIKIDFVMSQLGENFGCGVSISKEKQIPSIVWIRETTKMYRLKYYPGRKLKNYVNYMIKSLLFRPFDNCLLRKANYILTNSRFMQSVIKREYSLDSEVIYPTNASFNIINKPSEKAIGFVNPIPKKGLDVFIELVKRIPEYKFISFGNNSANVLKENRHFKNWVAREWVDDIYEIYSNISILVVPSKTNEAFGRVVIEAIQFNTLPIVSGMGGLSEALNDQSLTVHIKDLNTWEKKIRYYINNDYAREKKVRQLRKNLDEFSIETQGSRLITLLNTISMENSFEGQ